MIDSALAVERIEDSALPLHIVTTDVLSGLEVVHSRGVLRDALLASAAIPLVFPQVEIDGRLLMDGGVASNTPISCAAGLGARRIVVLPTGFGCACREAPRSLVALALHTLNLVSMRQIVRDIELVADRAHIHVSPPLCPLGVSVFDFSRTRELIERARDQTDQWLADGGLERSEVPGALRAHLHDAQA